MRFGVISTAKIGREDVIPGIQKSDHTVAAISSRDADRARQVADDLGIPAVEAIAVTQAIERIIAIVRAHDPTLDDVTFDVDVHDRAIKQAPYQRTDE